IHGGKIDGRFRGPGEAYKNVFRVLHSRGAAQTFKPHRNGLDKRGSWVSRRGFRHAWSSLERPSWGSRTDDVGVVLDERGTWSRRIPSNHPSGRARGHISP